MAKLEGETYEERIFELINALSNNGSFFGTIKWAFGENYFKVIRLLKMELQTDGKYDPKAILKNKYKLNLLIAFSYPVDTKIIKNIYKLIYVKRSDYPEVNFYEPEFTWQEDLPLETINELKVMQNQKKDIGLYLFWKKYSHEYILEEYAYYLPEGLNKIGNLMRFQSNDNRTSKHTIEINKFVETLRQNMAGKEVFLPKSLKNIIGDLFGETDIPGLYLNEGLEYFNIDYLPKANIKKIEISSTAKPLSLHFHYQNNGKLKEIHFRGFDRSSLYNNISQLGFFLNKFIKVTTLGTCDSEGKCKRLYELTTNKLIFDFYNKDYPIGIVLQKDECKREYSSKLSDQYLLIEKINDRIVERVERYQGKKRRKGKMPII